jgi:antitoxin component YwqK of YwqJK toxin-antitoxin module
MQTMKTLFFLFSISFCLLNTSVDLCAQNKVVKKDLSTTADTLWNQLDKAGNKQGNWFLKTNAERGEENTTSYGFYNHGMKEGLWYVLDEMNELLHIENYKNNLLDGEISVAPEVLAAEAKSISVLTDDKNCNVAQQYRDAAYSILEELKIF